MKKLLSLALILVMVLSLAACGGKTEEITTEITTTPAESVSDSAQTTAEPVSGSTPEGAVTDETKLGEAVTYSADGENLILKIKTSAEFDAQNSRIAIVNPGLYLSRDSDLITQCLFDECCFDEEFAKDWFEGVYTFKIDSRLTDLASGEWAPGVWNMMLYEGESRAVIGEWVLVLEGEGKYHFEFTDSFLKGAGEDKKAEEFETPEKEIESWFTFNEYNEDWAEFYFDGYYLEETDPQGYDKYYLMVCPEGDYTTYADADAADLTYSGMSEKCPYKFAIEQGGIEPGKYTMVLAKMGGNVEIQFTAEKIDAKQWKMDFTNAKCVSLSEAA